MPVVRKKIRTALPIYIAAAAWVVCAVIFPMYKFVWIIVTALISAGAYAVARKFCRGREVSVYEPERPAETGDKTVDSTLDAASRQIDELETSAGRIVDTVLKSSVERMVSAGRKIVAEAARRPEKLVLLRRFLNYYLPTSVKLINSYIHMKSGGIDGKHSDDVVNGVESNAGRIAAAFENQLDALYADESLDISTDLEVLDEMLKSDGLTQ